MEALGFTLPGSKAKKFAHGQPLEVTAEEILGVEDDGSIDFLLEKYKRPLLGASGLAVATGSAAVVYAAEAMSEAQRVAPLGGGTLLASLGVMVGASVALGKPAPEAPTMDLRVAEAEGLNVPDGFFTRLFGTEAHA